MSNLDDRRAARHRPNFLRLDPHACLCRHLASRLGGEVTASRRTNWQSITFSGTRHQVTLRTDADADRLAELPSLDPPLPGAFVARLEVVEWEPPLVTVEALVVAE